MKKELILTVQHRILMSSMLPQKGNFIDLTVSKDIAKKIGFNQEDIVRLGIKFVEENSSYSWKINESKKIELTEKEVELLKKSIEKMDKEGNIPIQLFDIFKLIID